MDFIEFAIPGFWTFDYFRSTLIKNEGHQQEAIDGRTFLPWLRFVILCCCCAECPFHPSRSQWSVAATQNVPRISYHKGDHKRQQNKHVETTWKTDVKFSEILINKTFAKSLKFILYQRKCGEVIKTLRLGWYYENSFCMFAFRFSHYT